MLFRFNITLTEEDYLSFNRFHSCESNNGKKLIRNSCIAFALILAFLALLVVLVSGWTTFSVVYTVLLALFAAIYIVQFKKIMMRNIKVQIKRMKKTGNLPFDPAATFELYEDKIVETTPSKRTELTYEAIERVCIVKDHYIFLYNTSVTAYMFPVAQIKTQSNLEELVAFLSQRCATVEYY